MVYWFGFGPNMVSLWSVLGQNLTAVFIRLRNHGNRVSEEPEMCEFDSQRQHNFKYFITSSLGIYIYNYHYRELSLLECTVNYIKQKMRHMLHIREF